MVDVADSLGGGFVKAIYTRDPSITVPGGAIVGRMGVRMRRGEEPHATRALAALGVPILGTITGTGTLEGGSFCKLRPGLAALGTSIRVNQEAARQLRVLLDLIGRGADRGADRRLQHPHRPAPRDGRRGPRAGGPERPPLRLPRAAPRAGDRDDRGGARGGVGPQPALPQARPRADGRGQPAQRGHPLAAQAWRWSRSPTTRSRRTAAACTARRPSSCGTRREPLRRRGGPGRPPLGRPAWRWPRWAPRPPAARGAWR